MELPPHEVRDQLEQILGVGWESPVGIELLERVRAQVVAPLVARAGLRGPMAAQAEASGWEAAWDALRRPSAALAENPVGMAWVAARRAIRAEAGGPAPSGGAAAPHSSEAPCRFLSLDVALAQGWEPWPEQPGPAAGAGQGLGPRLELLVGRLESVGWDRSLARDCTMLIVDRSGAGTARRSPPSWRLAAAELGLPPWQARRLAELLLGGPGWSGVPALMVVHGARVLAHPNVSGALLASTRRWSASPRLHLAAFAVPTECEVTAEPAEGHAS